MESKYYRVHEEPLWPRKELSPEFPRKAKTKGKRARKRDSTNRVRRQSIKFT